MKIMPGNIPFKSFLPSLISVLRGKPQAYAYIEGDRSIHPDLSGTVRFYQTKSGVILYAEVMGLPAPDNACADPIFGFHIHEGTSCEGSEDDPFSASMSHYNPDNCEHPYHAGDLPPLFGNNGFALSLFLTNRFTVNEITGKTIIIHSHPDDFTTQPSGNSGTKIACGVVKKFF